MKSGISSVCSYLFMATLVTLAVSLFAIVIIVSRHFFGTISKQEVDLGYKFLTIFVASAVAAPILLYINLKFDRKERLKDEESF
ncbi:MAG: hypothetical protein ACR2NC_03890 [Thermodesulfobacteriota bacterium]